MITDIPTADQFHTAGVNHIYLAWQIAMQATQDYDEVDWLAEKLTPAEEGAARTIFWTKSQPALANAFGLVQQAMEMALKGRIAGVSPYLLISRDPRDWPRGSDRDPVPFSAFRTLDAADLVKVLNTVAATPFDDEFRTFWEDVRRERNVLMHAVSTTAYDPAILIRNILRAVEALFNEVRWPQRLLAMQADGKYAGFGLDGGEQNVVMEQIETALRHLTPAEAVRYFGFNKRQRAYLCPRCWSDADRDWQEDWPSHAQLLSKSPRESRLHCAVCDRTTDIERRDCTNDGCKGNVIHQDTCLTCHADQTSPSNFRSGLEVPTGSGDQYSFDFEGIGLSEGSHAWFADDAAAIEHARVLLSNPHLQGWHACAVKHARLRRPTAIGAWRRDGQTLTWTDQT